MDTPFNKISGVYNLARLLYLKKLGYNIKIVCPINLLPPPKLYKPNLFFRYMKEQFSIPFDGTINSFRIFYPKYFCLQN